MSIKPSLLTMAVLLSFFTLSACGRDENYSDTNKNIPRTPQDTGSTRDSGATGETLKRSSTETSGGVASRNSSKTAEPLKTKETPTSAGSTVAGARRSDTDQASLTKSQTIEGLLLKVEGDSFLVKDISGKEVKLMADSNTKKDGNLTIGDRVVALTEDRGTLASINKR